MIKSLKLKKEENWNRVGVYISISGSSFKDLALIVIDEMTCFNEKITKKNLHKNIELRVKKNGFNSLIHSFTYPEKMKFYENIYNNFFNNK